MNQASCSLRISIILHPLPAISYWKSQQTMRTPTLAFAILLAAATVFAAGTEPANNQTDNRLTGANAVERLPKANREKTRSGLPWKSGVSPGTSKGSVAIEKINGFGNWRGRPVDIAAVFIGKNSWQKSYERYLDNEVLGPQGAVVALQQAGVLILLTVPLVTQHDAGKFGWVAGGAIDSQHEAVANKLKSLIGDGPIYLRLGHEADEGYPWSYTGHHGSGPDPANPAEYRAAWSRIAAIYKKTLPGAKLVWNVLKNTRQKITDYYPGDEAVDIISIDVYDNGFGGFCNSATSPGWVHTMHPRVFPKGLPACLPSPGYITRRSA